jgi:hypothetical protein
LKDNPFGHRLIAAFAVLAVMRTPGFAARQRAAAARDVPLYGYQIQRVFPHDP